MKGYFMRNFDVEDIQRLLASCHGIPSGYLDNIITNTNQAFELSYGSHHPILFEHDVPQETEVQTLLKVISHFFIVDNVQYLLKRGSKMQDRRTGFFLKVKKEIINEIEEERLEHAIEHESNNTKNISWYLVIMQLSQLEEDCCKRLNEQLQALPNKVPQEVLRHRDIMHLLKKLYSDVRCIIVTKKENQLTFDGLPNLLKRAYDNDVDPAFHPLPCSDQEGFIIADSLVKGLQTGEIPFIENPASILAEHTNQSVLVLSSVLPDNLYKRLLDEVIIIFKLGKLRIEQQRLTTAFLANGISLKTAMVHQRQYEQVKKLIYSGDKTPADYFDILPLEVLLKLLEEIKKTKKIPGWFLQDVLYQQQQLLETIDAWESNYMERGTNFRRCFTAFFHRYR
jgi:hypothetical protein